MSEDVPVVERKDIVAGLRRLGLSAGDRVMVHTSLKSFGQVVGGPKAIIGALQDVITPRGTLMLPSFNHLHIFWKDGASWWDATKSRSSNGAVPDAFWRMEGVVRSWDPSHPFAAWGKDARRYTQFHHRTITLGEDSPLGMLWRDGGYGLLLGVPYKSNTFHHVVEATRRAPCLGYRTENFPMRLPDGRIVEGRTWGWRSSGCPITDAARYGPLMTQRGLDRQTTVGNSALTLFKLDDCFKVISELLENGLDEFPPCSRCPIRPCADEHTVESDWDMQKNCLKDDSPALDY